MNTIFLFNIGLDLSVWVWALMACASTVAFVVFAAQAYLMVKVLTSHADHNQYQYKKARKRAIYRTALAGVLGLLVPLFLFGAYGAGQPPAIDSGRGEAIHENAGPPPTKQQLEKDSQKKVHPELKKQKKHYKRVEDPSDKRERDDADEYEKKVLNRN